MPKSEGSLSAVVVSGGKQYRVAPGDRILVDRLAVEPGADLTLERVLLVADGGEVKVGNPALEGVSVAARLVRHERGPKIDVLRYKSKKRVRVHRGARADLSALEIVSIGLEAARPAKPAQAAAAEKPKRTARAKKAGVPAEETVNGS